MHHIAERETYLTKDVFVAGATPRVTYNPRDERHLEREINQYLEQGPGRTLSVSGPTKSGKTVLVERQLPRDETIWMEGQDLQSVEVFWERRGLARSTVRCCTQSRKQARRPFPTERSRESRYRASA